MAAEKGSSYWKLREKSGVEPMFKNPEEIADSIKDYFENGVKRKTVIVGKGEFKREVEIEVPTITGLCFHLGFASRQSFYDYEKKDNFSYIIKRARLFIEKEYEEMLQINPTAAIFALKNMGWTDKQEIDMNANVKQNIDPIKWIDNE